MKIGVVLAKHFSIEAGLKKVFLHENGSWTGAKFIRENGVWTDEIFYCK